MGKIPLLGALLLLSTGGDLKMDATIDRYVDLPFVDPHVSVADVLEHRAGLLAPDLRTWRMLRASERDRAIPRSPLTPSIGYSDLLANMVMVALIESIAGTAVDDFLRENVLRPAGAIDLIQYGADHPEVNPAVAGLPHANVPLASERLTDQTDAVTPATGVFTSAKGLMLVLRWLFFTGNDADRRLSAVIARRSLAHWDPVLNRPADYAFGFMGDLQLHEVSVDAFGHTAAMAAWVAIVEPEDGSVAVGYSNGVPRSEEEAWESRNLVLAALRSDSDRIPLATHTSPPSTALGDPFRGELFDHVTESVGAHPVLPSECSFTIEVQVSDTHKRAVLVFAGGTLAAIHNPVHETRADMTLRAERTVFSRWLDDADLRLSTLIQSGAVAADGHVWAMSALDYWAAHPLSAR